MNIRQTARKIFAIAAVMTVGTVMAETESVTMDITGGKLRIDALAENLFRVRVSATGDWSKEGALNRYSILSRDWPTFKAGKSERGFETAAAKIAFDKDVISFKSTVSAADLGIVAKLVGKGYEIRFPLAKDERVFGLGDVSRENIQRRPGRYEIWVKNVNSYIPIPMGLTSRGWGFLMNTTWRNYIDVGQTDRDALVCSAPESQLDFYVFNGRGFRELLDIYTRLTGRPALLPCWGYGFTYVCNENVDMFQLTNEALRFRDLELPIDVMGLEPGWMNPHAKYDFSTKKKWDREKFEFGWSPAGSHTFIGALDRIGIKLSLWLCCNYDLFRYEEECVAGNPFDFTKKVKVGVNFSETFIDERIIAKGGGKTILDGVNDQDAKKDEPSADDVAKGLAGVEPWFAHLRKFVQQGAKCFKLDGAAQVSEHPGRKWYNGMSDEEAHNLYPLVYGKQMSQGFEAYTGKRSMVYSAGGYAGVQQFVATWAGDTGGGPKPLRSLINLGLSGHANQSCDMGIYDIRSLHFGFLQTWSQENSWAYWFQPWFQKKSGLENFKAYAGLRYRLIPYIYTTAAEASRTGYPVMRALSLVYPDHPEYDSVNFTYMLGDALLVSAFDKKTTIPAGDWYDYWTDEKVTGPNEVEVRIGPKRGGGLYVRAGAVIPRWPLVQYIEKGYNAELDLEVYAGADGGGELYEDDGYDLAYRKGQFVRWPFTYTEKDGVKTLLIGRRTGSFPGMPASHKVQITVHGLAAKPASVTMPGRTVEWTWNPETRLLVTERLPVDQNGATLEIR